MVIVRAVVAALTLIHVLIVAGALQRADLLAPAALAAAALVASSVAALLMYARVAPAATSSAPVIVLAAVDAISLVTIARLTVEIDPIASIAWCFVLWAPFSLAVRSSARTALVGTLGIAALVLVSGVTEIGSLQSLPRSWTGVGVPILLVLVAGVISIVAIQAKRFADVQVRNELERELNRTAQLREADDLKNTFLAAVSHELRTPLTSILGFAMTMLDRTDITDEQRVRMLRTMVQEAERLEDILANLLDLDRLTRGKATLVLAETDPAVILHRAVNRIQERSSRTIELDVEAGEPLLLDGPKFERIVDNLLGNAVKYTPIGSRIELRLRFERAGMTIRVDDGGPGISCELRERIFEPFHRGADIGVPGTGIGLSLVDRFARMHGGRAWVEERPGGGCRFQVYLPCPQSRGGGPTRCDLAEEAADPTLPSLAPADFIAADTAD